MAWLRVRVSAFTCVLLGAMATACVAPPPESAPRQVAGAPEPTSTHVIVRFGTPPTEARLKDLEKAGLRVIEAFDRTTYVARADEALDLASVATGNAGFTVAPVVADSKLGPWLREAEPPPWSRLPDGRVRVDAFFYEDVGPKSRNLALRRAGAAIREDAWPLAGSRRFIGQAGSRSHAVEVNARPRQQRRHPATTLTWVEADFWATADADPQWPESFVFLGRIIDTNIAPLETRIIGPLR